MKCRLIVDQESDGPRNMAVDEALLRSAAEQGRASLRFYRWSPATLSLGYFQRIADRKKHPCSLDCRVVRRASGGGAILHDHELTYCFACPSETRFGGAGRFYLAFHETLVDVLAGFGIQTKLHQERDGLSDDPFLCFQRRASGDVTLAGYKVGGSAQRRWKTAFVQHGSILLRKSSAAPELPGLCDLSDFLVGVEGILDAWIPKLADRLKTEFQTGQLTDKEEHAALRLATEKFSNRNWTDRR